MRQITRLPQLPKRPKSGHKGLFGKVLIIGGSPAMIGAPAFAALAALRTGCGLAYIAAPQEALGFILSVAPEAVGIPLKSARDLDIAVSNCDSIAIGPGMGTSRFAGSLLQRVIAKSGLPMVIDADGLNLLAGGRVRLARPTFTTVLTPHPGEMKRLASLFGDDEVPSSNTGRLAIAAKAAAFFQQVVILKGEHTVVADGERYFINTTGDSTLAKAGSGDILTGMMATLLAQHISPFDAACIAVNRHGLAGARAGRQLGRRSALARDVIDAIPGVLDRL